LKENLDINAGPLNIRLTSSDSELLAKLSQLFSPGSNGEKPILIDLDCPLKTGQSLSQIAKTDPKALLVSILTEVYQKFQGCLWLDASCLIKNGKSILIAGPSHSGKTTLSLAASVSQEFTIISEDITFISIAPNQIQALTLPLSLRPGTIERVEKVSGTNLPNPVFGEWVYLPELYFAGKELIESLHTVIVLEPLVLPNEKALTVVPITAAECIKKLLPLSNALRLNDGITGLNLILRGVRTFSMDGGALQERLQWLHFNGV